MSEIEIPDFIARAIEAQGTTTVDEVLHALDAEEPEPEPEPEPEQLPMEEAT